MMLLRSSSTPILSSALTGKPGSLLRTSSGENHRNVLLPVMLQQSRNILRVSSDGDLSLSILPEEKEIEIESDPPIDDHEVERPIQFLETFGSKLRQVPSFSVYEKGWIEEAIKPKIMEMMDKKKEDEEEFSFNCAVSDGDSDHNDAFTFSPEAPSSLNMAIGLGLGMDRRSVHYEQLQQHYEKIIQDNPGNPLMLRNYARYLYKIKQDYRKAEEFYCRAILADQNDGEVLSEYATLRWEIYRDKEAANCYFARSVQASPQNCHVRAAYASFLWDAEESEDEDESIEHHQQFAFAGAK